MSKRRKPGEIVRRTPGSGFVGSADPYLVKVPDGKPYERDCVRGPDGEWKFNPGGEATSCMVMCGDPMCREWANVEIVSGKHAGDFMYHLSECQLEDS